jgi:hypothetical protein
MLDWRWFSDENRVEHFRGHYLWREGNQLGKLGETMFDVQNNTT